MPLKTPEQYRSSLRDGRRVFFRGQRVTDVTTHPVIGLAAEHLAADYKMAENPAFRDLAVVRAEDSEYSRYYQVPRAASDLRKRSDLIALSTREGATLVALAKEIGTDALFALLLTAPPSYQQRVEDYYRYCRDNDLALAVAQTDVKGDRTLGPSAQAHPDYYVRIVDERSDGVVVRGAKVHTSITPNANEVIVLPTRAMKAEDRAYAVAFAVPVDTPGLVMIASPHGSAPKDPFEHPI